MCHIQVLLYYPCRRSWDSKFMFKFVSIVTLNDIIHLKYLKINIQFEYHSNGELRLNWRTNKTNFRGHDMFLEVSLKTKLMFGNTKYTTFECMETKLTLKYNHYLLRSKNSLREIQTELYSRTYFIIVNSNIKSFSFYSLILGF